MNDVPIYDANGNKQAISTLETAPGKHTQRTLVQALVGGAPTDVSATSPLPVDTELPAAAVPTDADLNTAVPAVAGRSQVWDAGATRWRNARSPADNMPATGTTASASMLLDTAQGMRMARSARSLGDSEDGGSIATSASMLYNGAGWSRARAPYEEILIPRGVRTQPDATTLVTGSSVARNYGFAGAIFCIRVHAAPTSPAAGVGLSVKIGGIYAGTAAQAALAAQDQTRLMRTAGSYYIVVYPGAAAFATGPAALPAIADLTAGAPECPIFTAPLPLPARYAIQIFHRGGSNAAAVDWEYEVSASYVL